MTLTKQQREALRLKYSGRFFNSIVNTILVCITYKVFIMAKFVKLKVRGGNPIVVNLDNVCSVFNVFESGRLSYVKMHFTDGKNVDLETPLDDIYKLSQ